MKQTKRFFAWLPLLVVFFVLASLALLTKPAAAAGEFVTTWKTDMTDPSDASLTIQAFGNALYDYTIDWGDGTVESNVAGTASHTYASPGTYSVKISGTYPRLHLNYHTDAKKLVSVDAWGNNQWTSMREAFAGATNVAIAAVDQPDLSNTTSLQSMFSGATNLSGNFSDWDVSTIVNFSYMFQSATTFNEDIASWDTSQALNLEGMFYLANSFNQTITDWVVSRATNFSGMFRGASSFNQPLNWDTENMQQSRFMFQEASDFNQNLSDWDVTNLQQADSMFFGSSLSSNNYDALLVGWLNTAAQNNVPLTNTEVSYCQAGEALLALETNLNWDVTDTGFDGSTCGPTDIEIVNVTDPSVDENAAGSVIGTLQAVDVEQNTYSYSIGCAQQTFADNAYFSVVGDELVTAADLDYENPADENGDNVYEICVTVEDGDDFTVQKIFNITVTDTDEPVTDDDDQNDDDNDTVSVSGGAVLGASTDNSSVSSDDSDDDEPQVLGASDESAVLAETGNGTLSTISVGVLLVTVTIGLHRSFRSKKAYKITR